ncbi:MAG TPA: hypothetical protein VMG39_10040 [Pseudolabrys sp.]|nr:hypothetical protein [Pseudolabrys sp.]
MSRIAFALIALPLLCLQPAQAAPMTCTSEQKTCITACQKFPPAVAANCIPPCRQRFNYCRNTGCWDNGTNRYCGLLRQ